MKFIKRTRWIRILAVLIVLFVALAVWQFFVLRAAHRSFADYAAFRGCTTVTGRSASSGTCTIADGRSITIVKFDGRWYLQGDLPFCWNGICL